MGLRSSLRPDAGEAHLATRQNLYRGYLDYNGALAELEVARQTLPNIARVLRADRLHCPSSAASRRKDYGIWSARWDLDPRNFFTLQQIALSLSQSARYADEVAVLDRALAIEPDDAETRSDRALGLLRLESGHSPFASND